MIKGKIAFANGTAVRLTGEVREVLGVRYFVGVALVGHFAGKEYVVSKHDSLFEYAEVEQMLAEEQQNYERLVALIEKESA